MIADKVLEGLPLKDIFIFDGGVRTFGVLTE